MAGFKFRATEQRARRLVAAGLKRSSVSAEAPEIDNLERGRRYAARVLEAIVDGRRLETMRAALCSALEAGSSRPVLVEVAAGTTRKRPATLALAHFAKRTGSTFYALNPNNRGVVVMLAELEAAGLRARVFGDMLEAVRRVSERNAGQLVAWQHFDVAIVHARADDERRGLPTLPAGAAIHMLYLDDGGDVGHSFEQAARRNLEAFSAGARALDAGGDGAVVLVDDARQSHEAKAQAVADELARRGWWRIQFPNGYDFQLLARRGAPSNDEAAGWGVALGV